MEERNIICSNCGHEFTIEEIKKRNPDIKIIGGKVPRYTTMCPNPNCNHTLTVTLF